jgi:restriction system protein
MLTMGYGGRRRHLARKLGGSGEIGVDGVIVQDELGLDLIYLQAKRFKPNTAVPVSDVRDFVGSLDARRAGKGVFVATCHFTKSAQRFVSQITRRVILIDGQHLTELMIRHNIGVRLRESVQFKRLDIAYFSAQSFAARLAEAAPSLPSHRRGG